MVKFRRARSLAVMVLAVALLAACNGYQRMSMGNDDYVTNYDNYEKRRHYNQADWPVNFIFYGPGANVNRVKSILNAAGADDSGGSIYLWLTDFPRNSEWDSDGGRKDTLESHNCRPWPLKGYSYLHMRVYADPNDRMSNNLFGNYVLGTTHYDVREYCGDELFGWSEEAEADWADRIWCEGYNFAEQHAMNNYESARLVRGDHVWQSDGWARKVYVPSHTPGYRCNIV